MKIYVVGGAVRDVLMGKKPEDIDYVVVGATPENMNNLGYTKVGADFPVFLDSKGEQYALARTERKVGSGYMGFQTDYNPNVTLEDDLLRRDLTINAMAVPKCDWLQFLHTRNPELVIDCYNGLQDLQSTTLRHVSPAFAEDPLRVLRVARFCGRYSFSIAAQTMLLMKEIVAQGEIQHLAPERVWTELVKGLMTDRPDLFVKTLHDCGALSVIAPHLLEADEVHQRIVLHHVYEAGLMQFSERARVATTMLYLKLVDAQHLLDKLKAPNDVREFVLKAIRVCNYINIESNTPDKTLRLLKTLGVYNQSTDLIDIAVMLKMLYSDLKWHVALMSLLSNASLTSKISFGSLPLSLQQTLKGNEISKEIDRRRLQVIELNSHALFPTTER